jgi:hypothetical protein
MIWMTRSGDLEKISTAVTAKAMEQMRAKMAGRPPDEIKRSLEAWAKAMEDYNITGKDVIAADEVDVHIHATPSVDALHSGKAIVKMKRIGNEWKYDGPAD